jgi:hypothetical protein
VTEALASEEPGVPASVSDAVLSRLARLTPAARAVVEVVSVVPTKAELWLLNESINATNAAVEECVSAGMLWSDNGAIGFRHELARRAIEDSVPAPRVHSLHAQVLKALVSRGAEDQLSRIVHHAAKSGDADAVLEYARSRPDRQPHSTLIAKLHCTTKRLCNMPAFFRPNNEPTCSSTALTSVM